MFLVSKATQVPLEQRDHRELLEQLEYLEQVGQQDLKVLLEQDTLEPLEHLE